ncbi:hypothetical protein PS2_031961 [Malus domestica]
MKENRDSFSYRFPQTAPNVDAQNRMSWNNVNPTVNLHKRSRTRRTQRTQGFYRGSPQCLGYVHTVVDSVSL